MVQHFRSGYWQVEVADADVKRLPSAPQGPLSVQSDRLASVMRQQLSNGLWI